MDATDAAGGGMQIVDIIELVGRAISEEKQ